MSESTIPRKGTPFPLREGGRGVRSVPASRLWPSAILGLCAAASGFGLARTLFEWQPQRLAWLGQWPGTLLLVAVVAVLGISLAWRRPGVSPWRALPLALPALHALAPNVDLLRGWTLLAGGLGLTGLLVWLARPPVPHLTAFRKLEGLLSLFLFLSLCLLYLRTLAPAVGEADTFEFQVGIARLGIAHGSGYPLLMLVGKLFTLLPLGGNFAWRANLTSAFFGALAAVFAARLARRLGAGPLPALLAGFTFGVSPTLWSRAVEVEAYTLNAALVAALLTLALTLPAAPTPRRLTLLAFIFGLSLTNHLTTILLLPALLLAGFFAFRPTTRATGNVHHPKNLSSFVLRLSSAFLLGLSLYLYLPLRWPAVNNGQRLSLSQFANILTGNEAKGAFQWDLPLRDPGRYAIVFDKLLSEYGPLGLAALAFALTLLTLTAWRLLRRHLAPDARPLPQLPITNYQLLPLSFAFLPYLYFALAFNVPDPDFSAFFIPLHLITAVLLGLGLQSLLTVASQLTSAFTSFPASNQLERHPSPSGRGARGEGEPPGPSSSPLTANHFPLTALPCLLLTASCLLPLSLLWRTLPRVDQSADWARYRLGQHILAQPIAPGATILADSQKIAPLYFLQVAEGVRPDLDIVVLPDEASYRLALDERIAEGRTIYLARYLPGLGGGYALRSVGPLAEVAPEAWTTPIFPLQPPAEQPTVPGLRFLGYAGGDGAGLTAAPPNQLPLTLAWQPAAALDEHLLVSLQLVDSHGQVAWRSPGRVPVGGLYPTNAWRPGAVVSDYYAIPLDRRLPPGPYKLQVGLFPPFAVTDQGWATVTSVTILPPASPAVPQRPLRARFGDEWLLGYDLPETAAPGAPVDLTLYWQRSPNPDQTITVLGETRSLAAWPPNQVVALGYTLQAPSEADSFDLDVALATGAPARCGWLAPITAACQLPPVHLAGLAAAAGARNFDHQLLLNAATLETPTAAPGGQVQVTLEWQGLRGLTEDYTVFVHLLGPDGLVHGQVDAWPVSGTQATSRWQPGQPIHDPYTIPVPLDAPPGPYQVEIGLYLLATGQRLPLINETGEIIDDRVLLDGLTIGAP